MKCDDCYCFARQKPFQLRAGIGAGAPAGLACGDQPPSDSGRPDVNSCAICSRCTPRIQGGDFARYATSPDAPTGNFQRHLDTVMQDDTPLFTVAVPLNLGKREHRVICDVPMSAFWQTLETELACDTTTMDLLEMPRAQRPPTVLDVPAYASHPAVLQARRDNELDPIPVAVYVDGVRFITQAAGRSESVPGIWGINLLSNKRHFLAPLKSGDYCTCGCRGWCSIQPLLSAVQWQLAHMQRGERPARQYDGTAWGAQ
eukprot:6919481-Pyramimonas_sp.AAC.1